jgi:hypothetical protein
VWNCNLTVLRKSACKNTFSVLQLFTWATHRRTSQLEKTMSKITTEKTYEHDLVEAKALMGKFVNAEQCDGNGRNWIGDALNDAWMDGMQLTEWVAKAVTCIPAGFRRSAE